MGEDFLSRWSRLKRQDQAAERAPPDEAVPTEIATPGSDEEAAEAEPAGPGETSAAITEEEIAALPPVGSLSEKSDLAPFLRVGVPSALRNAALRRMWSLDPAIRDFVSEAREYAYDWNSAGGVPGLGPLLPSDDVKAMARRIFEGPDRTREPDAAAADEIADTDAPDAEAERPDADARPALSEADRQGSDADSPVTAQQPGEARVQAAGPTGSEPDVRPRVRRHGSAMPG